MSKKKCDWAPRYDAAAERAELAHGIQTVRQAKGMSRRELCKRAGLPISALNRIERAKSDPKYSTIVRVARGLGVSLRTITDVGHECLMYTNDEQGRMEMDSDEGRRAEAVKALLATIEQQRADVLFWRKTFDEYQAATEAKLEQQRADARLREIDVANLEAERNDLRAELARLRDALRQPPSDRELAAAEADYLHSNTYRETRQEALHAVLVGFIAKRLRAALSAPVAPDETTTTDHDSEEERTNVE